MREFEEKDEQFDRALRPTTFAEYVGQDHVTKPLKIFVQAAKKRQEPLDHVLLFGPPGLGKTTLGHIIANELGVNMKQSSGPVLERAGDLAAMLTHLEAGDVLFIDEIHRLSAQVEEVLYPAMEDGKIDIMIGEGPAARSIKLEVAPFTLVGATTRAGMLTSPLRDRFGIVQRLDFYAPIDLANIIKRSATKLGIGITPEASQEIARTARGTPRIANRLLRRVRDITELDEKTTIEHHHAMDALNLLDVDTAGFDIMDRKLLLTLIEKFAGGPVGLDTLAAAIGESKDTIMDVIEPYLIQQGFIMRTPRGRLATERAYHHFGITKDIVHDKNTTN